jgi:hypothetical protein
MTLDTASSSKVSCVFGCARANRHGVSIATAHDNRSGSHFLAQRSPRLAGAMSEWAGACTERLSAAGKERFSEIGNKIMETGMTELAYLATRNIGQFQEQRRNKLQDAVSGIPPADQQQEIAAALELDKERRLELKSKIDELSTDEIERLVSFSTPRVGAGKIAESNWPLQEPAAAQPAP